MQALSCQKNNQKESLDLFKSMIALLVLCITNLLLKPNLLSYNSKIKFWMCERDMSYEYLGLFLMMCMILCKPLPDNSVLCAWMVSFYKLWFLIINRLLIGIFRINNRVTGAFRCYNLKLAYIHVMLWDGMHYYIYFRSWISRTV